MRKITALIAVLLITTSIFNTVYAQSTTASFSGDKTTWRGFDRYDFLMDTLSLEITPFKAVESEGFGINAEVKGKVRCLVVVPKTAAVGNPWSWRGFYWDHEPQSEVELLKKGFFIGYINCDAGRQWDAWYAFLTKEHGFSKKPAFGGMSRGAINAYAWSVNHPDQVSCIYADNAAIMPESLAKIAELAKHDVPLLSICGSEDFLYEKNTLPIENIYLQMGGRMTILVKEGTAHHPHSLQNPTPIVDWVVANVANASNPLQLPDFIDNSFTKSYYYNPQNSYLYLKEENTWMTARGPGYTPYYEQYEVKGKSRYGVSSMVIIAPNKPAPGKPWVFRSDRMDRNALVDQALLAKGYHIVITPITAQSGAVMEQWNDIYKMLIDHGFSKKPVLEGSGVNAGECFAWAMENPEKVSVIYAVNPVMRSLMTKKNLIEGLVPIAKAKVPLLVVSGSLDPWFKEHTKVIEQQYKKLGGKLKLIVKEGQGHFITTDPEVIEAQITKY
ncbi:alpha/beta hydrolase [Pedobacter foliorum]|uniref:alpha/beta hydrolase n=1 Tax=Pedobacter foliorum TaxID=2739058 RepID=UPI0015668FBE|nr:alpha/beta hydrolase [Pedobacter foliorum]NRF39691.1 alpha/beta hydrolase [Pedobacter foliorum]